MGTSILQKGDSLQDSPEEHPQGEDVCLGGVVASRPHLWGHVEIGAARGGERRPSVVTFNKTLRHLTEAKICHL